MDNRQVVLDTETTGLEVGAGHRVIEIGAIEIRDRRPTGEQLHCYLQPDRPVDPEAQAVHGISDEFLADKPRFAEIAEDFMVFIRGAELIIHNAPFDVSFLNQELTRLGSDITLEQCCTITDTLALARRLHPGQRNSLDALCRRYNVDNSGRELHGALLDAEILARVYLAMTGGQLALGLDQVQPVRAVASTGVQRPTGSGIAADRPRLRIIRADESELAEHRRFIELLEARGETPNLWRQLEE